MRELLVVAVTSLVACGGAGDPPNAQSFTVDPEEITEDGTVTLHVVASDPQGVDDLASVTVVDGASGAVLVEIPGPAAADGSFTGTVSWADLAAATPLAFTEPEDRDLQATVTDAAGNASGTLTASVTLTCPGAGGTGAGDKCFQVITAADAPVTQSCGDLCAASKFRCNTNAAVEAFGEVGDISFSVDDNGTPLAMTLALPTCETLAGDVEFELGGGTVTLSDESVVDWICNCRP